jgi:hypothetical protein
MVREPMENEQHAMPDARQAATRIFGTATISPLIMSALDEAMEKQGTDPMEPAEFDETLIRCFSRHLKSLSSVTIEEMIWANEHMDAIIGGLIANATGPETQKANNIWTYISGAIERKRLGIGTIINNGLLMRKTGWCHGDILKGRETSEISKAKNDFMEAAMLHPDRSRFIPCLHEWAPIGLRHERHERDETVERKRIRLLEALALFATHDDAPIEEETLEALVRNYKWHGSSQFDMMRYYHEHQSFETLPTTLYTLYALGLVDRESSLMMRGDSQPKHLKDMCRAINASIGYMKQGLPDDFIRESVDIR